MRSTSRRTTSVVAVSSCNGRNNHSSSAAEFDFAFAIGLEFLERVPSHDAMPFHGPERDRRAHERRAGFIRHDDPGPGSRREQRGVAAAEDECGGYRGDPWK